MNPQARDLASLLGDRACRLIWLTGKAMTTFRDKPADRAVLVLGEKIEEAILGFESGFATSGICLEDCPFSGHAN
jgi:hypothetical protein